MATKPSPVPSPSGKGILHEVRTKVLAELIVVILCSLGGLVGAFVFSTTALYDIFFPDRIDIGVSLTGRANPGDVVELYPSQMRGVLDYDRKTLFEKVEFPKIKNSNLEIRIGAKGNWTTVTSIPVGDRPVMNLQYEVK